MVAAANLPSADEILGGPGLSEKDAKLIDALIRVIARDKGRLDTEELATEIVRRSRAKSAPTHHLFEWDRAKGHAIYLVERAKRLVMAVRIVFAEAPKAPPVRAYPVVTIEGKKGPAPMRQVLSVKEQSAALLEQALAELQRFKSRYDHLKKLAPVLQAIDVVISTRGRS